MNLTQVQIRNWHKPVDLEPAIFFAAEEEKESLPFQETSYFADEKKFEAPPVTEAPNRTEEKQKTSMIDKLLPLVGMINGGGFDIASVMDLLDKSGQGFGALGKLLPMIAPLLQNGTLTNLFGKKNQTKEDIIDIKTINLDE